MANKTNGKQLRISLSQKDAEYIREVAKKLDMKETEVLRKGLKLMSLYAKSQDDQDSFLMYKDAAEEQEIRII